MTLLFQAEIILDVCLGSVTRRWCVDFGRCKSPFEGLKEETDVQLVKNYCQRQEGKKGKTARRSGETGPSTAPQIQSR